MYILYVFSIYLTRMLQYQVVRGLLRQFALNTVKNKTKFTSCFGYLLFKNARYTQRYVGVITSTVQ